MEYQLLTVEPRDGWWEVTIRRPEALNALNGAMIGELERLVAALAADATVGGMILTGGGEKAFVAGADIAELKDLSSEAAEAYSRRGQALFSAIERSKKPVIAAVNGFALGGGCELALACHVRVLSKSAKVGLPEVSLGLIPGFAGTQRLTRLVGLGRALELMLTGDPISADEALRIGLANRICEPTELMDVCRTMAARMRVRGPLALAAVLECALSGSDLSLDQGEALEARHFGRLAATEDWREGTGAFLEKRKPSFKGR